MMASQRALVPGGGGRRRGDVELKSRLALANVLAGKITALLRLSRVRAPDELRNLGFSRVEFSISDSTTCVTLHVGVSGVPTRRFVAGSGGVAAVLVARDSEPPELAVFDTGRSRIGATRLVARTSLDDPDSALAILAEIAPGVLRLGGHVAGASELGNALAAAFPLMTQTARRRRGNGGEPPD